MQILMQWLKQHPYTGERPCRTDLLDRAITGRHPTDQPLERMLDHLGRLS